MSLVLKDTIAHGTNLGVWKKEEGINTLETVFPLNNFEQLQYNKISNEKRKQEWLITQILLTELLETRSSIKHNEFGKPYLENSFLNLGISHSKNFVAIITSKFYNPGVDIEHVSQRAEKVKHKFLGNQESMWCTSLNQLTAGWCVKEAIFKTYEKDLAFHDIVIDPFNIHEDAGTIEATVIKGNQEKPFSLTFQLIEDDILIYTLPKPLSP